MPSGPETSSGGSFLGIYEDLFEWCQPLIEPGPSVYVLEALMRVLVFGATGMLGHKVAQRLARGEHEVFGLVRAPHAVPPGIGLPSDRVVFGLDVRDMDDVGQLLARLSPDVVVNCVGIVKQSKDVHDPSGMVEVNALFPHQLASACDALRVRMLHISTDCVFSGRRGNYAETDVPDPMDLYGRTKLAGEPESSNALTLRTSILGRELGSKKGLLEWFLSQQGSVEGYRRAIFSGLPTVVLADLIDSIINYHVDLNGTWHVSANPISKYELLSLVCSALDKAIKIVPVEEPVIDRSLDSSRFRNAVGWRPPGWPELVDAMVRDWEQCGNLYAPVAQRQEQGPAFRSTFQPQNDL